MHQITQGTFLSQCHSFEYCIKTYFGCVFPGVGVTDRNRLLAQCALHLRQYNNALLINDTVRMVDAFRVLESYYSTKTSTATDGTNFFLLGLYQGENPQFPWNNLSDLLTYCMRVIFSGMLTVYEVQLLNIDSHCSVPQQRTRWS